ncbi:hypothetical protein FFF34_000455 [Inquilinus sp. KBS0705]|nr:hypothetical protein FFF34_000455 [Inquilinus sp. KBS0705]
MSRLRLLPFLLIIAALSACSKKVQTTGCPTGQMCTMIFTTIGVEFVDSAGVAVKVKDVNVVNQRTNTAIIASGINTPEDFAGQYVIVTDGNKKELSTQGDDVKITATSVATGQTISAMYKISGGCNCHVAKVAGPEKIVFTQHNK